MEKYTVKVMVKQVCLSLFGNIQSPVMHFSGDISVYRFFQPKPIWLRGYLDVSNTDTKIQVDLPEGDQ